jgi:hypothetical protein
VHIRYILQVGSGLSTVLHGHGMLLSVVLVEVRLLRHKIEGLVDCFGQLLWRRAIFVECNEQATVRRNDVRNAGRCGFFDQASRSMHLAADERANPFRERDEQGRLAKR